VFGNGVLRIFGPKSEEVSGSWRKLHKGRLHKLYALLDIARIIKSNEDKLEGGGTCIGEKRNACRIVVRKSE
jgi:hypothetical protein